MNINRRLVSLLLLALLLLAGCLPLGLPGPVAQPDGPPQTEAPSAEAETAALVVRQALMQRLHADVNSVRIASVEAREWQDGCLGLGGAAESCLAQIVPGYEVVLVHEGQRYVYRTDADAQVVRAQGDLLLELGATLVQWSGPEGAACTTATIGSDGVAFGRCGSALQQGYLVDPQRQDELMRFLKGFAPFEADTPAGHVALMGAGTQEATPTQQRMVAEWARLAALEAEAGRSGASWGLALAWHREGGIAGFCDDLTIYVTGRVTASSCRGETPQTLADSVVDPEVMGMIYGWLDRYGPTEVVQEDEAMADAMSVRLVFSGAGEEELSAQTQQAMLDLASALFAELGLEQ